MELLILPALWMILIVYGIKYEKGKISIPFSKENSSALRGIAAIGIIIGHMPMYIDANVLNPIHKANILFVGIFFVLSGYGIAYSFSNRENYLKHFVPKKIVRIMIPVYFIYVLGVLIMSFRYDIDDLAFIFDLREFVGCVNWFVYELLAFYITTYIIVVVLKKMKVTNEIFKSAVIIMILCVIFMVYGYIKHMDENYYSALFCYPAGMILYYVTQIEFEIKLKFIIRILCETLLFGVCCIGFLFLENRQPFASIVIKNMAVIVLGLLIFELLGKFRFGNRISRFLGKISFELYLIHIIVIGNCRFYIENNLLCALVSVLCTVIIAFVMNGITQLGRHLIKK